MEIYSTVIDGKTYDEMELIEENGNKYAYLVNESDEEAIVIRKVVGEKYAPIRDENEYKLALMYYLKKHKDEIKEQLN